MRTYEKIVVHCTATKEGMDVSVEDVDRWHKARGFRKIGYNWLIKLDGTLEKGRNVKEIGAHAKGYNSSTIGIAYVGGLDSDGKPKDTRTIEQKNTLNGIIEALRSLFGDMEVVGHRDLSVDLNGDGVITKGEYMKMCPCFSAIPEYNNKNK